MKHSFKILWHNLPLRFLSVLGSIMLLYGVLSQTGVFTSLNNSGKAGIVVLLTITGIIVGVTRFCEIVKVEGVAFVRGSNDLEISKRLKERTGTVFSQITSEKRFVDQAHKYSLLHRQDLLNHKSGHFNSFRHIKGINVSRKISGGLIYCESTEYKIPFTDTRIEAIDLSTGTPVPLRVESLKDIHERCITHAFKIHFRQPLQPGDKFDIAYSIFLPKELECLDQSHEIMSISLIRIKQPIEKLIFNVCLEFNPTSFRVYEKSLLTGKLNLIESPDIIAEAYTPGNDLERRFTIDWLGCQPSIIRWECITPKSKLYVIEYSR